MNRKYFAAAAIAQAIAFIFVVHSHSLETLTHGQINEYLTRKTLDGFSLDTHLKTHLGIQQGVDSQLQGVIDSKPSFQAVSEWFKVGGVREDNSWSRSVNHFHNPLTDEGFSGVWGLGYKSGDSSVVWSQKSSGMQDPGGHYSWYDVRDYFYEALIAKDQVTKENKFAETFRGLGQLMHLVQDLSVPEHARNDGHYLGAFHLAVHYEQWVKNIKNVRIISDPSNPLAGLFTVANKQVQFTFYDPANINNPNPLAPVPVANLFDSNQYVLPIPGPSTTLHSNIGLSEYTNANFFSPETIFDPRFPFPMIDHCVLTVDSRNGRQYLSNRGPGEHVDHLAAAGWMYYWRSADSITGDIANLPVYLDHLCYEEYASRLLPRAVGYSVGLLKYFFRGAIKITDPEIGFGHTKAGFDTVSLFVQNVSPEGEDMTGGTIELVVRYKIAGEDDFKYIVKGIEGAGHTIPRISAQTSAPTEFIFDLSENPIPVNAKDISLFVVYKGQLGLESGSVAVGYKTIPALEVSPPEKFVYSVIDGSITPHQFDYIKAKVKNANTESVIGAGALQAMAIYKKRTNYKPDLSTDPPNWWSRETNFSLSFSKPIPITSLPSESPQEFTFDFSEDPIPAGITDLYLQVSFTGTIKGEADSLAMGLKDLNEPMHICAWNATDRFYLNHVFSTAEEIKRVPSSLEVVDLNHNGIPNETGEPYIDPFDLNVGILFYPEAGDPPGESKNYLASYLPLPPGRHGRIVILTDAPKFNYFIDRESLKPFLNHEVIHLFSAVTNQEDSEGIFHSAPVYSFRGIIQHQFDAFYHAFPDYDEVSSVTWPGPENNVPCPMTTIDP